MKKNNKDFRILFNYIYLLILVFFGIYFLGYEIGKFLFYIKH
jgi:hypothetical protein